MTPEYSDVIILVTELKFYFSKIMDVSKIMGSKVYKLSIFKIPKKIPF